MSTFMLVMDDHADALAYMVDHLSQPQRAVLVLSKIRAGDMEFAPVYDNENVVRSLMRGTSPLVEEIGSDRCLSELGKEVARYLIQSGDFEVPGLIREPQAA